MARKGPRKVSEASIAAERRVCGAVASKRAPKGVPLEMTLYGRSRERNQTTCEKPVSAVQAAPCRTGGPGSAYTISKAAGAEKDMGRCRRRRRSWGTAAKTHFSGRSARKAAKSTNALSETGRRRQSGAQKNRVREARRPQEKNPRCLKFARRTGRWEENPAKRGKGRAPPRPGARVLIMGANCTAMPTRNPNRGQGRRLRLTA